MRVRMSAKHSVCSFVRALGKDFIPFFLVFCGGQQLQVFGDVQATHSFT
jgi:hypothetical protein